jgi:MFS family permease
MATIEETFRQEPGRRSPIENEPFVLLILMNAMALYGACVLADNVNNIGDAINSLTSVGFFTGWLLIITLAIIALVIGGGAVVGDIMVIRGYIKKRQTKAKDANASAKRNQQIYALSGTVVSVCLAFLLGEFANWSGTYSRYVSMAVIAVAILAFAIFWRGPPTTI